MKPDLTPIRRAASIDIGTNTFLLLVADVEGGGLRPLLDRETIVRLGQNLQSTGVLSEEAMERGLRTLTSYLSECRAMGVQKVFAVGTSALREARNAPEFLEKVRKEVDLAIEIISGEEEAQFSFSAVAREPGERINPLTVVDVGGGSTEIIEGQGERVKHWVSLPLGAVHLTEQFLTSDPVRTSEFESMERAIKERLGQISSSTKPAMLVAVGGTATTLVSVQQGLKKFVPEKIHQSVLKKDALASQVMLYRLKTVQERKKIPGLPPARADVILAGASILYGIMGKLGSPSATISCHGVRYGVLYHRLCLQK